MMFFKKMIVVHGYIGENFILRHFCKTLFLNYEPFLVKWALKFQKSDNMT
jgi:hypothetical protein